MFVSNLVTGGTLARLPSRSSSTIAPLITLWLVGWLVSPFWVALVDERVPWPWTKPSAIVWGALLVPFLYVLPLLLGSFIAQRREVTAAPAK